MSWPTTCAPAAGGGDGPDSLAGMRNLFLSLHVLTAIFAVGPLVAAATTASRGLRQGDAAAVATASRTARIYSYASVLVIILGMGVLGMKESGEKATSFGELWVWLSLVLWIVAIALVLGVLVPGLNKAGSTISGGGSAATAVARTAAVGGIVGLLFAVIVFLMVYRPGH